MRKKLLLYGASGHGSVVADAVLAEGGYQLVGFIDDDQSKCSNGRAHNRDAIPVLACTEAIDGIVRDEPHWLIVSIGANKTRVAKATELVARGLQLASVIHPDAVVASNVRIGAGTVVLAGAVINSRAVIGDNVIVNTAATVDHDCVLADGVHLSPGVRLAGGVRIGAMSHIGIGAVVIQNIDIGIGAVVGAGAVVIRHIPPDTTVIGNPAREMRNRPSALVRPVDSILTTLEVIERGTMSIALVLDEAGRLLGSVTDGDVRRGILRGVTLAEPVVTIMNPKPIAVKLGTSMQEMRGIMLQHDIKQIPVIDDNGQFVHIVMYSDTTEK